MAVPWKENDRPVTDLTEETAEETPTPRVDYAARRAELRSDRRRGKSLGRWWKWFVDRPGWQRAAIGLPVGVVLLVVILLFVEVAFTMGRVHPGVDVAGVNIGGKTPQAARETLDREIGLRMSRPVAAVFEDQSWSIEASTVAGAPDTDAMVEAAMAVGRTGSLGTRISDRAGAWFGGASVQPVVVADPELLASVVSVIEDKVGRDPVDASVVIEDTSARVEPAELGVAVRHDDLIAGILAAFASDEREVPVGVEFVPVQVTDEEAETARLTAETMMSEPVKVTYEKRSWEFPREDIAGWIAFRVIPTTEATGYAASATGSATPAAASSAEATGPPESVEMILEAYISAEEASATITEKVGEAGREAQDASFRVSAGTVTIVPSQDGVGPDIESLAKELTRVLSGDDNRSVELRTRRVEPEITTDDAKAMGIKERLSTYTTTYVSSNKPRVNNIHTLAAALDGTLIPPGGVFSFNETIGPRTAAKGYQEAPAIVNGKLVPQLGGGICQVGTTIFNAVFESGLPVVERKNHSFYISHYPKGRDATVSWGGPDFKFKNDTEQWVLVATGVSSSSLTISIYGTDPGYDVLAQVGNWTNVKPHPVEEVKDDTMPEGSRVVEDGGVDGRTIVVTRIVTKDGSEVRRDTFNSVYRPKAEVVRVGTKKASKPTTQTATP